MPDSTSLKRGDFVRIRPSGTQEWLNGMVGLASPNGKSLVVLFDGAMRTAAGGLLFGVVPLCWEPDTNVFTGLITPDWYEIERV